MVETKKPNLITTLEKSEPFTVKDIGTFWPLIISKEATVHYVEFVDIPPHYHTKTEERFHITEGGGIMEYGPFMTLSPRSQRMGLVEPIWDNKNSVARAVRPGLVVDIPPYMPHRMIRNPEYEYIGTLLVCKPPLNPKDEIGLRMKEKA